jgi:hypothetical protein
MLAALSEPAASEPELSEPEPCGTPRGALV